MAKLSEPERFKLSKILGRLGDENENIRAIAAKAASEFVALHGLTWLDVLNLQPSAAAPRQEPNYDMPDGYNPPWRDVGDKHAGSSSSHGGGPVTWRGMAVDIINNVCSSKWEKEFAEDLLNRWYGELTARQQQTLEKIHMEKCK